MFTGLVEDVGVVDAVAPLPSGRGRRLALRAGLLDEPVALGDSLATSGVCLTAVAWRPGRVEVDVGPETLSCTTLGALRVGERVNLERALRLGDRLGGHLVAGHVDGVGTIRAVTDRGEARDVTVALPAPLLRYVIPKGSVAVDGISLTVNEVTADAFTVSLIPHTQQRTTLAARGAGERVNIEVDLIGKYVERLLGPYAPGGAGPAGGLDLAKLREYGFVQGD